MMGVGYGGMMGGFGFIFVLVYLGVVIYFFYLLTGISKSLRRIADSLEKPGNSPAKPGDVH
jgi:uncharacterized membrane protein